MDDDHTTRNRIRRQLAAVTVLDDGGTVAAAVTAGLLLNMRSLAFGVATESALWGPLWWRALVSQLMIDESTAVGAGQQDLRWRGYGYLAGGVGCCPLERNHGP